MQSGLQLLPVPGLWLWVAQPPSPGHAMLCMQRPPCRVARCWVPRPPRCHAVHAASPPWCSRHDFMRLMTDLGRTIGVPVPEDPQHLRAAALRAFK